VESGFGMVLGDIAKGGQSQSTFLLHTTIVRYAFASVWTEVNGTKDDDVCFDSLSDGASDLVAVTPRKLALLRTCLSYRVLQRRTLFFRVNEEGTNLHMF
jgi:hypothetical protein